jgi:hypothetical protein
VVTFIPRQQVRGRCVLNEFFSIGCLEVIAEGVHLQTVMRHEQSRVVVLRLAARRQQ